MEVAVELVPLNTATNATRISSFWILAGAVMTTEAEVDLFEELLIKDTAMV
jgi:hypothetical protein